MAWFAGTASSPAGVAPAALRARAPTAEPTAGCFSGFARGAAGAAVVLAVQSAAAATGGDKKPVVRKQT